MMSRVASFLFSVLILTSYSYAQDWEGTWVGKLENFPSNKSIAGVTIEREIGKMPTKEGECTVFRTRYTDAKSKVTVKDYLLCRGKSETDFLIDEQNGIKLPGKLLGNVLVTSFKYGTTILTSHMRVENGKMVDEILVTRDKPAKEGVVTLEFRSIQRMTLVRRK